MIFRSVARDLGLCELSRNQDARGDPLLSRDLHLAEGEPQCPLERVKSPEPLLHQRPYALSHVPYAERHEVSRVRLPQDNRCALLPLLLERLSHREPRRVEAAADLRVGGPPEVFFVIPYYVWLVGELVPGSVGEPGFDPLEPPLFGQQYRDVLVVVDVEAVNPELVNRGVALDPVDQVLADCAVHSGDGPSRRDNLPPPTLSKHPETERLLDPGHEDSARVERVDGLRGLEVSVVVAGLDPPVD